MGAAVILGLSGGGGDPSLDVLGKRFRFFALALVVGAAEEHSASMNMSDSIKVAEIDWNW